MLLLEMTAGRTVVMSVTVEPHFQAMTRRDSISGRANTLSALQKLANFYVSQRNGHKCHPSNFVP